MQALGAEVRKYFDEQISILLARMDSRMDDQAAILTAIKELQMALTADRVIINDSQGRPAWYPQHQAIMNSSAALKLQSLGAQALPVGAPESERPGRLGHPTRQSRARPLEGRHGGKL